MVKKLLTVLIGLVWLTGNTFALEPDTRRVTTTHRSMVGLSTLSLYDDYLSAEPYKGLGLQVNYATSRYPSNRQTRYYFQQDMELVVASTLNRAKTASISQTSLYYAWGMLFTLKPFYGIKAAVGPMIGASGGLRMHSRNVNNPVNVDLMGDVQLAGNLTYDMAVRAAVIRFKASLRAPVLGFQFAPLRGISYYEMLTFSQFDDAFHFTSLHNKNAWSGHYTVDIPLHALTISLGVLHRYALFDANDLLFKQDNWSFQAGCTFDVLLFSGASRPNAASYLSLDR